MIVGILGGGQLGRMLALAGYPLGLKFRVLDPGFDPPAGDLAEHVRGGYSDPLALERFRQGLAVATYELEGLPSDTARGLTLHVPVFPPVEALEAAQDRLAEKTLFQQLGIPTPLFQAVDSEAELAEATARLKFPAVLKTRRFGYDGKGQFVLREPADVTEAWRQLGGQPLILEAFVRFERELSLLAVRSRSGETAFYPLVENSHREGILRVSRAPAPHSSMDLQNQAVEHARRVLEALNYVGVLAIEFFQQDGQLIANEMAPRVHNSGHWTIEGAVTSQFENHLRAILGLPLGSTEALGSSIMVNLIGTVPSLDSLLAVPGAHAHLYGEKPQAGRKLGHVTLCGQRGDLRLEDSLADLRKRMESEVEINASAKRCET